MTGVKYVTILEGKHAKVPRELPEFTKEEILEFMDKCLPEQIENEHDMKKFINRLWIELVNKVEI
jgi:hypothetical protein